MKSQNPADQRSGPAELARRLLFLNLLLCPLLFTRHTLEIFEYPKALLLRGTALVLLCGFLASVALRLRRSGAAALGARFRSLLGDPIVLGVLLFLVSAGVSTWGSISRVTSVLGAEESYSGLLTVASYAVLFFATRAVCREARHYRELLVAAALATLLGGAYALVQGLKLDPLTWRGTHAFLGVERAFSTFGNPTFLGGFMAMVLPLVAYLALRAARRGPRSALLLWGPSAALAVVALGLTLARGPWLASLAGGAVLAVGWLRGAASPRARRRLLLAAASLLVLAVAGVTLSPRARGVVSAMTQRLLLTVRSQSQERPEAGLSFKEEPRPALWRVAWSLFRTHPLTGVGLDAFQLGYVTERSVAIWRVEGNRTPQRAHNELLNTLATQGALGGAALALLAAGLAFSLRRAARRHPDEIELLTAAAAALVAMAVHVSFSFTTAPLGLLDVTLLALISRLAQAPDDEPPAAELRFWPVAALAALPALLLVHLLVLRPLRADLLAQRGAIQDNDSPGSSIASLGRAVKLDPLRDHLWARLGVAYMSGAEWLRHAGGRGPWLEQARRAFEQAMALVPRNPYHHMSRARVLLQQALESPRQVQPEECLKAYEEVLRLDRNNPFMYAEAGRAALELQDGARLRAWSRRCLEIDPDYGACRWLDGRVALQEALSSPLVPEQRQRQFSAAGDRLRDAVMARWYGDDRSQAAAATQGAAALLMAGRVAEGVSLAETAIQKNPDYPDGRYNLGKAYERQGRLAEAIAQYREALRIDGGHVESRRALFELAPKPAASPTPRPSR